MLHESPNWIIIEHGYVCTGTSLFTYKLMYTIGGKHTERTELSSGVFKRHCHVLKL